MRFLVGCGPKRPLLNGLVQWRVQSATSDHGRQVDQVDQVGLFPPIPIWQESILTSGENNTLNTLNPL